MGSPSRKYRDPSDEDTSSVGWFLFAEGEFHDGLRMDNLVV